MIKNSAPPHAPQEQESQWYIERYNLYFGLQLTCKVHVRQGWPHGWSFTPELMSENCLLLSPTLWERAGLTFSELATEQKNSHVYQGQQKHFHSSSSRQNNNKIYLRILPHCMFDSSWHLERNVSIWGTSNSSMERLKWIWYSFYCINCDRIVGEECGGRKKKSRPGCVITSLILEKTSLDVAYSSVDWLNAKPLWAPSEPLSRVQLSCFSDLCF